MGRKRIYETVRIENIVYQIALWELRGLDEMAHGLRLFFGSVIDETDIEKQKAEFAKYNKELAANYTPKPDLMSAARLKTHQYSEGATWEETRTVRNRKGGKTYKYKYRVTVVNGKRKSECLGRAGE